MKAYLLDGVCCLHCQTMLEVHHSEDTGAHVLYHMMREDVQCPNSGKTFKPPTIELEEA